MAPTFSSCDASIILRFCQSCKKNKRKFAEEPGNKLTKLSVDHVHEAAPGKKAPLTQCLGVPESEFTIEPYIAKGFFLDKERYLLCSDGLTDMVSDDEICSALSKEMGVKDIAETLLNKALENGGADNITIIICETKISRRFPWR
jgi:protein phosphatase